VKIKTRPEHASMPQMTDWLAELQDGERAEPADRGPSGPAYAVPGSYAVPTSPGQAVPTSYVRAVPAGRGYAVPAGHGPGRPEALARSVAPAAAAAAAAPARTATPAALPGPSVPAAPAGLGGATARAVIGDQLRRPIMWCEMGSCVSWHADPAALGEADARARAIGAGWRIDAFGRLTCPRCQQTDPGYWAACRVVPWDRSTAIGRTVPIAVVPRGGSAGRAALRTSRDPGRSAGGYPPASRAELEWHHDLPAADVALPTGRYAGDPVGTWRSRLAVVNAIRAWRGRGGRQTASRQASEKTEDLMSAERAHANPGDAIGV